MFIRIRQVLLFIHYLLVQGLHHYVASLGSAKYLAHARLPRTTLNRNMQNQTHKRKCCCRATRERYFCPVGNVEPRCRPLPLSGNRVRSDMRWCLALRKTLYPRIYVTERPIRKMAKDKRCYSEAASITYRNKVSNREFEPFEPKVFTPSCLGAFTLLAVPSIVSREPKCGKYQKADAGADRAGVVRPCGAQETQISVVPRRDDRDDRDRLERRPAATAVVEHEFEHAVPVRDAECGAVHARLAIDGEEPGTDVRVEHGELELQIVQPRVGRPSPLRVVPGDMRLIDLSRGIG